MCVLDRRYPFLGVADESAPYLSHAPTLLSAVLAECLGAYSDNFSMFHCLSGCSVGSQAKDVKIRAVRGALLMRLLKYASVILSQAHTGALKRKEKEKKPKTKKAVA